MNCYSRDIKFTNNYNWYQIYYISEFASRNPPFREDDSVSVHTEYVDYNPAQHNPVFYGKMHQKVTNTDFDPFVDIDPAKTHPSCVGFAFTDRPPDSPPPPPTPPPHRTKCKFDLSKY